MEFYHLFLSLKTAIYWAETAAISDKNSINSRIHLIKINLFYA
ncbi:hypothetical protein CLV25_11344 [Acetobacteroides hydrogenigenes]|uniref:Uncharacterized protein n=1 Tax=Acetobacteroides hydrogenigenes TaxID=979970 RepID=A0A4R2EJW2_9BACT|nr:hypothetical protein CLV25_11344 [Acetobacteroides hydrogenigenes]